MCAHERVDASGREATGGVSSLVLRLLVTQHLALVPADPLKVVDGTEALAAGRTYQPPPLYRPPIARPRNAAATI